MSGGPRCCPFPRRDRIGASARAPILLALALACLFIGGQPRAEDGEPKRLEVREVVPSEVEVGDRIAILGSGFAPSRVARVTFRGTLHRPGERPAGGAEIVVPARVVSPERIEIGFDEATQASFAGGGEHARHTTFEGDVEVALAAAAPGEAPLAGTLSEVTLDVRPSMGASLRELEQEGQRVLSWIGVQATAKGSGLLVEAVKAGSRAEAAGIVDGDVITAFDGVRVASTADVVPHRGERSATIALRSKTGAIESARVVALDGLSQVLASDRTGATLIALLSCGLVLLFAAPTHPALAAAFQRVVSRMRERAHATAGAIGAPGRTRRGSSERRAVLRAMAAVARSVVPPYAPQAVADLFVCALLMAMPFGQYVIASRLDVGILFVATAASLGVAAFLSNGSALRGAVIALEVVWGHAPSAAAVASVVMMTGSLRIQEIAQAQGGWPWEWLAFRSPGALVAFGLLLASARIQPDAKASGGLFHHLDDVPRTRKQRGPWLEATCRAHRLAVAGLATALFLGGWHLPGRSAAGPGDAPTLEVAGATWLLAKTWAVVVLMAWIGWALPRWDAPRTAWVWLVPSAVGTLAATAAWTWWSPGPAAQELISLSLVAMVGLTVIAIAHRLNHGLTSATGDVRVSGFI